MPRETFTEFHRIEEILKRNFICTLALEDESAPYLFAMNYGYQEGVFYFHASPRGKKAMLFRKNKRAGFWIADSVELFGDMENPCSMTMHYESVTGKVEVMELTEASEKNDALNLITAQAGGISGADYSAESLDGVLILRAVIIEASGKRSFR
ncbi:MAG TPA: pyridoxamine 5'-phosphate oxidase family protein [Candidatus Mcinerneyibacteriales bacterium]|nr:pyridoxamine 5'-phosphate oxidase family protein [Candidatus Mcinerneyibacteriales bacterium]